MKFKEFIEKFKNKTTELINFFEKQKKLTGAEKKAQVDFAIKNWVEDILQGSDLNFIIKFILKKYVLNNIPVITQSIFDLIKIRIEGITEEKAV